MNDLIKKLRRGVQEYGIGYARNWIISAADDVMAEAAYRLEKMVDALEAFPLRANETAEEYVTMVLGWWVTMGANAVYHDEHSIDT